MSDLCALEPLRDIPEVNPACAKPHVPSSQSSQNLFMAGPSSKDELRLVRLLLIGFAIGLLVSGITAFPLPQEVKLLAQWLGAQPGSKQEDFHGLTAWIVTVRNGLVDTDSKYPFLFYGTDWLAFAHVVIAILFIGPIKDPVRNVWIIRWGMIACALVIPLALFCGGIRGIPFGWRLIDCSFGVIGILPLIYCDRVIRRVEASGTPSLGA